MKRSVVQAGVWSFFLLLLATGGNAFEWYEHRELSNAALVTARRFLPQGVISPEMLRQVDARAAGPLTFGDVTVAVDWFQNPEKLIDPATVEHNVAVRRVSLIKKGLAAHHNAAHFQASALTAWQKYHKSAVDLAAEKPRTALLFEAVALHFLQDFFAAGHVVTPRRGMHDAAAGHLHDTFNRKGVSFALSTAQPPEVEAILRNLVEGECLSQEAKDAYESAEGGAASTFYGDTKLSASREQRAFLMVVSTLSVTEVLRASTHTSVPPLQTCFSTRQVTDESHGRLKIEGPDGGIRIADAEAPRVVSDCGETVSWLGRYGTRGDKRLGKLDYDLSGLNVRGVVGVGHRSRDSRVDVEALLLSSTDDPPGALKLRGTDKDYPGTGGLLFTTGPTYSHGTRYNAWGWLGDFTRTTRVDLISIGGRIALRRYGYGPAHPWRADYGLKIGVGYQVVNVVLAVDRMHTVDSTGKFAHDYFGSIGADAAFSASWLRFWRHKRE